MFYRNEGRSYIYTLTRVRIQVRTDLDQNVGRLYHSPEVFLMLCVQNVRVEPILIFLYPILIDLVMMLVSPPHMHTLMIYQ